METRPGLLKPVFTFLKLDFFVSNKVGHVQDIQLKEGMKHQLITQSLRPLLFGK